MYIKKDYGKYCLFTVILQQHYRNTLLTVKVYRNTSITFCAVNESKPDVGSSQNINGGSVRISAAKDNRFISPPEIPLILFMLFVDPANVLKHLYRPN